MVVQVVSPKLLWCMRNTALYFHSSLLMIDVSVFRILQISWPCMGRFNSAACLRRYWVVSNYQISSFCFRKISNRKWLRHDTLQIPTVSLYMCSKTFEKKNNNLGRVKWVGCGRVPQWCCTLCNQDARAMQNPPLYCYLAYLAFAMNGQSVGENRGRLSEAGWTSHRFQSSGQRETA